MSPAIVRIGERVWSMRAPWARGKKVRFADLHALRRGKLPAVLRRAPSRRQLPVPVVMAGYAYLSRIFALHPHYENRVAGRARNPVNFFQAGHHVP